MANRHNLCANPALKNNNTGWAGDGGAPAATSVTGFVRSTGARYTAGTTVSSATGTVTEGVQYTLSCYAKPSNNTSGTAFIEWTKSGGGHSYDSAAYSLTAGAVGRVEVTATAPTDAVTAGLILSGANYASNTTDVTATLIEAAAGPAGTYFDGDTATASWDGADGNSASTLPGGSAISADVAGTGTGAGTVTAATDRVAAVAGSGTGAGTVAAARDARVDVAGQATGAGTVAAAAARTAAVAGIAVGAGEVTAVLASEQQQTAQSGWWGLLAILRESAAEQIADQERILLACPNDGEPYVMGPDGQLFCRFDGHRPGGSYVGS